MVKNIVFDMGGVLIDFDPDRTLSGLFDAGDAHLIFHVLFESGLWQQLDLGILHLPEIAERACTQLPERLHGRVTDMLCRWWSFMPPIDGMEDFVRRIKANGYGVYLLSNTSDDVYANFGNYPVLSLMDGIIASCDYGVIKPDARLYEALYTKYALQPSECFFIDDVQKNIDGAAKTGMAGHCFADRDLRRLCEDMRRHGIQI